MLDIGAPDFVTPKELTDRLRDQLPSSKASFNAAFYYLVSGAADFFFLDKENIYFLTAQPSDFCSSRTDFLLCPFCATNQTLDKLSKHTPLLVQGVG